MKNIFLCVLMAFQGIIYAQNAKIKIDVERTIGEIDPKIYGVFMEPIQISGRRGLPDSPQVNTLYGNLYDPSSPLADENGFKKNYIDAMKELKITNIRWPGGNFLMGYNWQDGIGPKDKRPARINMAWGGIDNNHVGTDEWFALNKAIGSENIVAVNLGLGTIQDAAYWLEYCNYPKGTYYSDLRAKNGHPAPYKIAYLGIGNESWDCGGNMTPDYYLSQLKIYSRFARNFNPAQQGNNQMLKIAVGPGGNEPRFIEWTEAVMKAWQNRQWSWDLQGLSLHNYTVVRWDHKLASVGFGESEYSRILKATLEMEGLVSKYSGIMDKYDPQKNIALVVDEWGSWYASLPGANPGFLVQQNSIRDAILAALNLNIFARHADRVRMANIAQMINVLQAMIMTNKEKMVLTPSYYVYKLYLPFQDGSFVPVDFNAGVYTHGEISLPRLDAIAAKDSSGKLWLEITNLDPNRSSDIEVTVAGLTPKKAIGQTLTAPKVDSVNTFESPNTVVPKAISAKVEGGMLTLKLEPKSVTVISVEQ